MAESVRVSPETATRDAHACDARGSRPLRYRIHVLGQLDPSWAETLGGAELVWDADDNTLLECEVVDSSALRGVLMQLFDLGSVLLSVTKEPYA